jgi:hypothetical protein
MILIKPPIVLTPEQKSLGYTSIFLAGSIEMGKAIDWQSKVQDILKDSPVVIFSPRRDDWDSSWKQDINEPKFNEQVTWELDHIDQADYIFMYFDPNTKSPITLLELGILAASPTKVLVCCPEGYWRKGNVDIVCQRYGISQLNNEDDFYNFIKGFAEGMPSA